MKKDLKNKNSLERDFINMALEIANHSGQDRLLALIISTLFIEPQEITMEELAKKCGYSLASISQKLKFLSHFNIIEKNSRPGSKKIYLYIKKDFLSLWLYNMINAQMTRIATAKEETPLILKRYQNKLTTQREKAIYKILQNYYRQIIIFDKILKETINLAKKYQH